MFAPVEEALTAGACTFQSTDSSVGSASTEPTDCIGCVRKSYPKNTVVTYFNINSIHHKFHDIISWLISEVLDIACLAETKIDSTFPDSMFHIPGFRLFRKDRSSHGGGFMVYIRSDIPSVHMIMCASWAI